ncbi:HPr kinase/phosphorylase [Parvularcula bermudensis]|uniref:HPr kinase/phosphorylase n=1 Tax=Parvularcula bermudensis TaxID=208216 RepID=UPI0003220738|nr:hypothetical protein [Parvularcula bermudensis]
MSDRPCIVAGTALAVAISAGAPLVGVILLGPSGIGKTETALRWIEACPFGRSALISDDQVTLRASAQGLSASPPPSLAGRAEIRGTSIVSLPYRQNMPLHLALRLVTTVERRLPDPARWQPLGPMAPDLPLFPWRVGAAGLRLFLGSEIRKGLDNPAGHRSK